MTSTTNAPVHEPLPAALAEGYAAFRQGRLPRERERFHDLSAHGQKPAALVIGCCDSRVAPESIFDVGPGEVFVVRNIAALVPPYEPGARSETAAAIEYAVLALKVSQIVVMGHAQCGGIRAHAQSAKHEFSPLSEGDFISPWIELVKPAAAEAGAPGGDFDGYCEDLGRAAIVHGLANLRTYPFVREREAAGELSLHGARFAIADASLTVLDQRSGRFVPVGEKGAM